MLNWLKDWWRGYDENDLASVREKMRPPRTPGKFISMTSRELRAFRFLTTNIGPKGTAQ